MWGGLTLAHTRAHLFRAVLESVAFGGRAVLETLEEAGVDGRELVVTGGAARSNLWMQIHADVLGRPLLRLAAEQPVTLGAAMCAAVGAGAYPSLAAAAAAMSETSHGWLPDPERHQAYRPLYASYLHRLASVTSLDGPAFSAPQQSPASRSASGRGR
jgi:sugar (pentulose or hexulose) kinase